MTPTPTIVLMTEEEVSRCVPADDEPGFGSLSTERGPLPLKAMAIHARIDGLLADVTLAQTFVNTHAEPLEATYIFPLPDRAAVTHFHMEVGGRVIDGVLKERGAARREYDQAIRAGHRAAITEEERPGVFTLRVGNLMPGEAATVHLSLSGPLIYDAGEVTFRFPLVVAPRYIPGTPLSGPSVGDGVVSDTDAVPDASRISPPVLLPGYPNPVSLSLTVDVESAALAPRDFRCSLHTALIEADGRVARISLQPGERLNRDFILRFRVGDEALRSSLALLPDQPGARTGTFVLTLLPPTPSPSPTRGTRGWGGGERGTRSRDVVFVLDRSGSMGGWKMVAARRALARMVDTLTERDRFSVYAFDDRIDTVPDFGGPGLTAASDRNRFRAVEFLAKVDARGGTELAQPLDLAVQQLDEVSWQSPPRERILVLITDGQVGNEDQILRLLGKRLAALRIFTLGIDQAVNEGFLKRLATLGGGFCEVVESEDRLDEVMKRLHSRIGTPVLTGLKLEEAGFRVEAEATVPSRLPDLFAGAALQVMGRYQGVPEGSFLLSGQDAAGRRCCEAVSSRVSDNPALAKAWARAYVRELEDRFVTGQGDLRELEKRIVEVSLKFGVLCRFTSYLAVDRSEVVNEGGSLHGIVQPVEMPAGWATLCATVPPAVLGAAPAGGGLLGKIGGVLGEIFGRPTAGRYLGKGVVEFKEGLKGLPEDADTGLDSSDYDLALNEEDSGAEEESGSQVVALDEEEEAVEPNSALPSTPPKKELRLRGLGGADSSNLPPPRSQGRRTAADLLGKVFGLFKRNKGQDVTALPAFESRPPQEDTIDLGSLRQEIENNIIPGSDMVTMGKLPQTPGVKQVIEDAVSEARALQHTNIDPEHLLLGLLHQKEGIAAEALRKAGLTLEGVHEQMQKAFPGQGKAAKSVWAKVRQPYERFTERARRVMQVACQEAQRFNHEHVGTEHILLGLIKDGSAMPANALQNLDKQPLKDQPTDLSAYRSRAADLLEQITLGASLPGSQRLHELGVLTVSLKALIEDLTSVGASPLEIRPLQTLLADLTALLEQPSPDEPAIARLWTQAEEVLRVFAGEPVGAPAASQREGFWK